MHFDEIPVIDIGSTLNDDPAARKATAAEVRDACMGAGFFLASGHGVPESLIDKQFDWARRFFELPVAVKQNYAVGTLPGHRGWEPLGAQVLDADALPDHKESLYTGIHYPHGHPNVMAGLAGYSPSVRVAELPGFGEQMDAYVLAMRDLGMRIVRLLALSLDLEEDYFDPMFEEPMGTLRLLRYPPQPADSPSNQFGAGAHTDWEAVTLLAQDDAGGLEVRNPDGEWIPAPPTPGTFVVNLGDMIPRWTNGYYRSNLHRVINRQGTDRVRYSIPFFFGPNYHARIECVPSLAGKPPLGEFTPCTVGEHVAEMYARTQAG
ncbi:isopenicillin N synthase family dioxygenase [Microbaculum marinum]|uniref:2-oxoglutarate-dependent ethylene/succinate-forming enzyme n=1 Tax=Microbaculum marinum TaxID=1764581 RepID=A0AAW9RXY0_9HYPH